MGIGGRNRSWRTEGGRSGQKLENELLKLYRRQKKEGRNIVPRPNQCLRSGWPDSERDTHYNGNLDCLLSHDTSHAEYLIWPGEYLNRSWRLSELDSGGWFRDAAGGSVARTPACTYCTVLHCTALYLKLIVIVVAVE